MITRQHSPSTRLPAMQGCFLCFGKTRRGTDLLWHVLARPEAAPPHPTCTGSHGGRPLCPHPRAAAGGGGGGRGQPSPFPPSPLPVRRLGEARTVTGDPTSMGLSHPNPKCRVSPLPARGAGQGTGTLSVPAAVPLAPQTAPWGCGSPPPTHTPLPQRRRRKHNKKNKIYKPGGNYSVATKGCLLRAIIMWLNLTPRVPGL